MRAPGRRDKVLVVCESGYVVDVADAGDFPGIRDVVAHGLADRWGHYDSSLNRDLESIDRHYANDLVLAAKVEGKVIGCGILVREREGVGRIVRMSVAEGMRRKGVGSSILEKLLAAAHGRGYREVVLETAATWESAVRFYTACGFEKMKVENGDQNFRIEVSQPGQAFSEPVPTSLI